MPEDKDSRIVKIVCPGCGNKLDVTDLVPFSVHPCPKCGLKFKRPAWFINNILLEEDILTGPDRSLYRALEPALDREAVVKLLKTGKRYDAEKIERLLDAARKQALINYPSVASVYSCGKTDDGGYVVSEYAAKRDWPKSPLHDNNALCQLAASICDALEAADASGVSHGGLTPQNVLFTADGNVLLTDFGAAAALGEVSTDYSSPEDGTPSRAGDIYSLGVCLYELATAKLPVGDPVPTVSELNPDIPRSTSVMIMKMLSPEAGARPSSLKELAQFFRENRHKKALRTNMPSSRPPTTAPRPEPLIRNKSINLLNIFLMLCIVVLVILGAIYYMMGRTPAKAEQPAQNNTGAPGNNAPVPTSGDNAPTTDDTAPALLLENGKNVLPKELLDARPRPHDLDFKNVKKQTQAYLAKVPVQYRELERERIRIVGTALDNLKASMKIPYDPGRKHPLRLRNGKKLNGRIPLPPRDGKITIRPYNDGESLYVKLEDLDFTQLVDMFVYYAEKRKEMSSGIKMTSKVKEDIFNAYFSAALLCDWYDRRKEAEKLAITALKYRPGKRDEVQNFGLPVPKLIR